MLSEPCRTPSAPDPVTPAPTARPLEGVKILDFMWVMAGPAGTRVLADMGATVVRIESNARIDTARTLQPFKDNTNSLESSALFSNMNAGKLGVTINPTTPEGMAVIEDLIRWADVVTESYSPRAMANFGLDYESVRKINTVGHHAVELPVRPDRATRKVCWVRHDGGSDDRLLRYSPAGPTGLPRGHLAPIPTTSHPDSPMPLFSPRSTTDVAPARANILTSRKPRDRCT